MKRNLKALGLTLVAAFAMSAMAAASASATSPWHFGSTADHTILAGVQHAGNDQFSTHAGNVSCSHATYTGTIQSATTTTTEVSVAPTYTGCTAFGFVNVPVHPNGCSYRFTAGTLTSGNFETGGVHIDCPAGKVIEITAPGCTVTVEEQTVTSGTVTFTNKGAGATAEVTIDVALTGIHYIEHNKGIFPTCGTNTVTTTNGSYTGAATVTGQNAAGAHVGVSVTGT